MYWSRLASDYLTIITLTTLGVVQLSGGKTSANKEVLN